MRRALSLAAFALGTSAAAAQEPLPSLGAGRVAAQVVAGTAAMPVGYVAGGLAARTVARALGASDQRASRAANAGAYAGTALAVGGAVSLVGARGAGAGSYPASVGGAAVGLGASKLLARAIRGPWDRAGVEPPCRIGCRVASAVLLALPSVGATIAYDVTRKTR